MWESFIEEVMPTVLAKCTYEKAFIANIAKLGSANASKVALLPATCKVLVDHGTTSKNMNLVEYSLMCLTHFVKLQPTEFFGHAEALNLGNQLSIILESKKTRLVKVAKPILKEIENKGVNLQEFLQAALMA